MAIEGMDVDQVTSIGHQLQNQASQIGSVISAIDHLIANAEGVWKGNDAQEFNNWWQTQHKPHLSEAQNAIQGLGQSAINNANDQRAASSH